MSENSEPAFLVNAYSDPVIIKLDGRASYLNSAPLRDFFNRMVSKGRRDFVLDFRDCTGMDSTFLGIIAGAALEARNAMPQGTLVLCRLSKRNLELVRNLGLHRIVSVDCGDYQMDFDRADAEPLANPPCKNVEKARMILKAHEDLVDVDRKNRTKFQDVISFLKNQVGPG